MSWKILASIFGSLKCIFPKCTFSGPQIKPTGYLLNSIKALASLGRPSRRLHKKKEKRAQIKKTRDFLVTQEAGGRYLQVEEEVKHYWCASVNVKSYRLKWGKCKQNRDIIIIFFRVNFKRNCRYLPAIPGIAESISLSISLLSDYPCEPFTLNAENSDICSDIKESYF